MNFVPIYETSAKFRDIHLQLTVAALECGDEPMVFLEDAGAGDTRVIICAAVNRPVIYELDGQGDVLRTVDVSHVSERAIRNCFTLADGNHLVQTKDPTQTFLCSQDWQLIAPIVIGKKPWHGSWSVDQNQSGTVMYAEYWTAPTPARSMLHVWASYDGGRRWKKSLSVPAGPTFGAGEIRHFHTCFKDPYAEGTWYASTGDILTQNRLYVTRDDGQTWEKLSVAAAQPFNYLPTDRTQDLFRFTSVAVFEDKILWPTDDSVGLGHSVLVEMEKNGNHAVRMQVSAIFSKNLMRNMIAFENGHMLYVSEAKSDRGAADLFWGNEEGVVALDPLPNTPGKLTSVMSSKSSKRFRDGTAFSLADTYLLENQRPGLLMLSARFK